MSTVSDFSYLWDGSDPEWVLWEIPGHGEPGIFHRRDRQSLIIESDSLYSAVVQMMREHGVRVYVEYPGY